MSIVKDKNYTMKLADRLSTKLVKHLEKKIRIAKLEDEPAENIYLMINVISSLIFKISVGIEQYNKTYGIEMDALKTFQIIQERSHEYIKYYIESLSKNND